MGPVAKKWLLNYGLLRNEYNAAALLAKSEVERAIAGSQLSIHSVTARAKSLDAATSKIGRKRYGRPSKQMTDVIGVRIITSYAAGIEPIVERLRDRFEVDDKNSVDKRMALGISEFGYRSVHLVVSIDSGEVGPGQKLLRRSPVEIQVRSIVEHAWAEAEHEIRYKSGVELPEESMRLFNALAGALEVVDREFNALSHSLVDLVATYQEMYSAGRMYDEAFDSARLLAFLSFKRPNAVQHGPRPLPLTFRVAAQCVAALTQIKANRARELEQILSSGKCRRLLRDYADERRVEPEELSALVIVGAAVLLTDESALESFPFLDDSRLRGLASSIDG